jgi:hypothetical protein
MVNFHHFVNIRKAININKIFLNYIFILKNKIYFKLYNPTMGLKTCSQNKKYLINVYLHIWVITKTWLNFLVNDLEED